MTDPRYPIGKFQPPQVMTPALRAEMIEIIAATPRQLREVIKGLSEPQLDTPYRDGGWTVRQVVHHLPDSHLNAYTRFKLALTEDSPLVKPYDEAAWAELRDSVTTPIESSLALLEGLHVRWTHLLRGMPETDFARAYRHPEMAGPRNLDFLLSLYAWHGPHHVEQIAVLRERMGW